LPTRRPDRPRGSPGRIEIRDPIALYLFSFLLKLDITENAGLKIGIISIIEAQQGRHVLNKLKLFDPLNRFRLFPGQTRQNFFGPVSVEPIISTKLARSESMHVAKTLALGIL
jgi:hypothetical protein